MLGWLHVAILNKSRFERPVGLLIPSIPAGVLCWLIFVSVHAGHQSCPFRSLSVSTLPLNVARRHSIRCGEHGFEHRATNSPDGFHLRHPPCPSTGRQDYSHPALSPSCSCDGTGTWIQLASPPIGMSSRPQCTMHLAAYVGGTPPPAGAFRHGRRRMPRASRVRKTNGRDRHRNTAG